ncbi:Ger(x)C family spore germination protein [Clostridium lundense]|uniref:Ger(x)C family spore germination protein n=1 Tax=Clostridium lundense TaxID=319475 RepID=UPI000484D97F|nr:Ger(x)C family spore germination protein [Clostridium lundense]
MKKLIVVLIVLSVFLQGCWDQKIYENTGFVLQVGLEPSSNDQDNLLITYSIPVVEPNAKEQIEVIYNSNEKILREFREDARRISPKLLEGGKVQQILISESLAAKGGISNLLEVFERDPSNPSVAYVAIVDGSPKNLIKTAQTFGDKPRPAFYVNQLIEHNIKLSYVPDTQVHLFTTDFFSPGIDPIAPILKIQFDKGKGVETIGTALFSGDKFVGKIDTKDTLLLLSMMGKAKKSTYINSSLENLGNNNVKKGCAFNISKVKRKIGTYVIANTPAVDINLDFKGSLSELYWDAIPDKAAQKNIEKILANEIEKSCKKVLKYTQEVGSDPLGIGDIVRAKHNSYWKSVDWNKVYPHVNFNINVNVHILHHGNIN